MTRFEWDPDKAEANRAKHGVTFEEARSLLTGEAECLDIYDREHSFGEDRFIAVGLSVRGVICVVYSEDEAGTTRIISARRATRREAGLFLRFLGRSLR